MAKLGGRVLQVAEKKLLIFLPRQAVAHLRADPNVWYVQRVWTGESFEDWQDVDLPGTSARVAAEAAEALPTWTTGEYVYDGSGNIASIGTDNAFTYDAFGRLVTADVKGVAETYTYDVFGNRTASTINGRQVVVPVDPLSNRLANYAYDAAGNVTSGRGFTSYQYDAAGMPSKITTGDGQQKRMIYTPDDERIGVYMNQTLSRWTIRDFAGQVLREFEAHHQSAHPVDAIWLWAEDYVYAGGAAVGAEREPHHGGRLHFHRDHLGSTRMMTTESGRKLAIHDYAPFGRELTLPTQEMTETARQPEPMKFTGHERDYHSWSTMTGDDDDYLDYMHARYYNAVWGRFLSVDPKASWRPAAPQSWNRYSYAANNPLKYTDPDGREIKIAVSQQNGIVDVRVRLTVEMNSADGPRPSASTYRQDLQGAASILGGVYGGEGRSTMRVTTTIDAVFTENGGTDPSRHQLTFDRHAGLFTGHADFAEQGGNEASMGVVSDKWFAHEFAHWLGLSDNPDATGEQYDENLMNNDDPLTRRMTREQWLEIMRAYREGELNQGIEPRP